MKLFFRKVNKTEKFLAKKPVTKALYFEYVL